MFEIKKTGVKFNSSSNFYRFKSDEELLKLLSIQSKHEENPFYSANLFNRIGKIYLDENNFETAIEYFKKAIKLIDDELGIDFPDIEKTISYNMLGITYSLLLDYDTAILCHKRALFSLEYWFGDKEDYAEDISAELARTYDSIGTIFYKREEFDLAIVYHKKALAVREYIGYYISQPEISYRNLGLAYSNKDDHDQAIHYHKQALYIGEEIFPGVPYPEKDLIENYQIFGSMYHDQKELYIASECFKKALILAEKKNDIASHEQIATIYNNLGAVYYENNNIDNALNCSSKSLEIYSEIKNCNNRELAKTYNNIGIFFQIKGNLKTSLEYISKAAVIYEQEFGENDFETVKLYYNLANSYNETGDYDSAIIFFNKVISYYDKFDLNSIELADAFQGIGYTYLIKGEHKLVSDYYFKALDIKKKKYGDQHPLLADIFHSIGQMFYVIGDNDLRIEYYEKSVLCDNEKNIHYLADLGRAYLDFKKYSKSASLLLSTIRKNERFHYLNLLKSFYKESSLHIYHYTLSALFYLKDFNNFFNISESIHASEYLKRLSLRRVIEISEISVEDCFALLKYKDSIERISSQLNDLISLTSFDFKEKPEFLSQITALSTQMAQAESDFIALDNSLMSNEKYKQLRNPDIATIDEAKKLCGADGVIFEYIIPPHKGEHLNPYILVISAEYTEVIELDKEYPYSEKIESLREEIIKKKTNHKDHSNHSPNTVKRISSELYNILVKPVEEFIEKKQNLIIVPDGPLAFLPFDALRTGENKLKDKSITLTPSVSVSIMTRKREYSTDKQFLGFGGGIYSEKDDNNGETKGRYRNREFSPDENKRIAEKYFNNTAEYFREHSFQWNNLSGAKDEVIYIGKEIFKNPGVDIYTGLDVTEKKLKQLSAEGKLLGYSSIHFSCHGYFDPEFSYYSALIFSEVSGRITDSNEDGYLTVEDASVLNIQADIVVLSACNTGMGKFVSGDGITGLTRAFQVAGANSVLVTLWEVDDEATKEFMISMYEKVHEDGCTYRDAVNRTKEEFRGTSKSDPYYWAGFVLYE